MAGSESKFERKGSAEGDSPLGRYDDLDDTHLATGHLLDIFQEASKICEVFRGGGEDVQAIVHVKSVLEGFWDLCGGMVGRLFATVCIHFLL